MEPAGPGVSELCNGRRTAVVTTAAATAGGKGREGKGRSVYISFLGAARIVEEIETYFVRFLFESFSIG